MLTLIPAYGRDYKSKAAVFAALAAPKDFEVADLAARGRYSSAPELFKMGEERVKVRYDRLRKVAIFELIKVIDESIRHESAILGVGKGARKPRPGGVGGGGLMG